MAKESHIFKFVEGLALIPANDRAYSRTCYKRSPCIERLVVKVTKLLLLHYCNSHLYKAFTAIKRSCSLFIESQRPFCIVFHLY